MKILKTLAKMLKDWHDKSHQKWLDEQNQQKNQQQHLLAHQKGNLLPGELATVFRGQNYVGISPIQGIRDIRPQEYFFRNGRTVFVFTIRKAINCDLPASDLALIKRQMNQDIDRFKEETVWQEGEEILAGFFPCLYQGACVAKVANSSHSQREATIYVIC